MIFVGGVMLIKLYSCFKYEVSFIWVKLSAFYLKIWDSSFCAFKLETQSSDEKQKLEHDDNEKREETSLLTTLRTEGIQVLKDFYIRYRDFFIRLSAKLS